MSPDSITPSVHPDLAEHAKPMTPRVITVRDKYHVAYAYAPSNCTLIEGDDGCVLVDTLTTVEAATPAVAGFRERTDKPIRTVIFTHFHNDHVGGVNCFIDAEDVAAGKVEVIAHEDLTANVLTDTGLIAPILGRRALYQFGMRLPEGVTGSVEVGCGPVNRMGKRGFIQPTRTFSKELEIEVSGLRVQMIHLPSETQDQIGVWLPDDKVLLSADIIQGETFPNIYALRGTRFRSPMQWVQAIDRMRALGAEVLIPHHGRPVEGAEAVADVLTAHRDAIQYMHDQTVRLMNRGYTPDEIAHEVTMPDHLKDHPWLGEFYGSYKHGLRNIYAGYVGWFHGDPVDLDPKPRKQRAANYVALMGGREELLKKAQAAYDEGDYQWAAELASWPIQADWEDQDARQIKADALRAYGYAQKNATWRNWSLTAAMELEGTLTISAQGLPIGAPEQVKNYPAKGIVELMTVMLDPVKSKNVRQTIGFKTNDTDEACALEIRQGVCEFHSDIPASAEATVSFNRAFLTQWVFGQVGFESGIEEGQVSIDGDSEAVIGFLGLFDSFSDMSELRIVAR